jgi:hypothetical protein
MMIFKSKKSLVLVLLAVLLLAVFGYLFLGSVPMAKEIKWGVNFSQKYASQLGLDWKEVYSALFSDMGVKNLKVAAYWDLFEPEKEKFYFDDLDWQVDQAKKAGAKLILIIGMKTSRWPECHIPSWAKGLPKSDQQKEILRILEKVVLRYKDSDTIAAWQVENEPFFPFGECPWTDKKFLKEEIEKVKSLDSSAKPVIVSDSGEGSLWINAAKTGDIVGTTMYKKVWFTFPSFLYKYFGKYNKMGFYVYYPFPPVFYGRKAEIINKIFHKEVICIELQAEPWSNVFITDLPLKDQEITMNLDKFKYNMEFAKKTGLREFYLWGTEWMYWMKTKQNDPRIWDEAKKLFNQ